MAKDAKEVVVISGVNFVEGGPLSVFKDAVKAFIKEFSQKYKLVVLINSKELFSEFNSVEANFYEYAWVKKSWLFRLWFEYVTCYFISKKIRPFLWFALHDITPNVISTRKAVYCHNASPFYKLSFREARMDPTLFMFSLFYKTLYKINIRSNNFIVVQQEWLRREFSEAFKVTNVIVAHPDIPSLNNGDFALNSSKKPFTFFYPAYPRVFKNFEILLAATEILLQLRGDFQVIITMAGDENKYAQWIYKKYKHLKNVEFAGIQARENIFNLYATTDCLVFPSKLETWGLPISEMKFFNKPILVANEQYAAEVCGNYDKIKFFESNNAHQLAAIMNSVIDDHLQFDKNSFNTPAQPFSESWKDLFNLLLS